MCSGQPPGDRPPTTRIASGSARNAVGSAVPGQSNSFQSAGRSAAGRSARGWSRAAGRGRADPRGRGATPEPFGAHSHLCPLPVQYAAPSALRSTGTMPGACAASTSVSTPSRSSSRTIVSIGRTMPLGLVTWLMSASRVSWRDGRENRLDGLLRVTDRERDRDADDPRPRALGDRLERVQRRVVLVVVRQELVAGPQADRGEHRRDPGRRVRHRRRGPPGRR